MSELKAGDRFRWKTTRVVLRALVIKGDNVNAVVVAAEGEWGRDMIGNSEMHSLANIAVDADIVANVAPEPPPADPLAGVDWSRYLPKEGGPIIPGGHTYQVGDVWAHAGIVSRRVFRVIGVQGDNCEVKTLAGDLVVGPLIHGGFVSERCRLIARDGKLVAGQVASGGVVTGATGPLGSTSGGSPVEPQKPAPRVHDFSNPYLVNAARTGRRCVDCGWMLHEQPTCEPRLGWRDLDEMVIGKIMVTGDSVSRTMDALFRKPRPAPYRNDVAGIGAVLGGYLNVAPERGR